MVMKCYTYYMWIKKNWMEEAGSPEIKTLEQFENLMKGFMTKYGAKYAMPLSKKLEQFYMMSPTFHAYPTIWLDDGTGKIVYGSTMPEMKPMLAKWAEWYKTGICALTGQLSTSTRWKPTSLTAWLACNRAQNWYSWVIADTFKNTGDNTWLEAYDLPSVDGKPVMYPIPFPNGWYNVVTTKCKNPEVLILS